MKPQDVTLCVPYFGGKDDHHLSCIDAARALGFRFRQIVGHPYIDQARCLLAELALSDSTTVVLFIDHDIIFNPVDLLPLAEAAVQHQAVVSGLYLTRKKGGSPVVTLKPPVPAELICYEGGGLYPCLTLPGGFTAIPSSILENMNVPSAFLGDGKTQVRLWFFNDPFTIEPGKMFWGGEDFRFSQRVIEAGFPLFVDTRPRLIHRGMHNFGLEDGEVLLPGKTLKVQIQVQNQKI